LIRVTADDAIANLYQEAILALANILGEAAATAINYDTKLSFIA
jgi:hypothetical protein